MGVPYRYPMVKQNNKTGFTLIEMLIVMSLITLLTTIFLIPNFFKESDMAIIDLQLEAMASGKRKYYSKDLWFNGRGNINLGQTININGMSCIFQLGFGRYRCE